MALWLALISLLTAVTCLSVGLVLFSRNPQRLVNRVFLGLCLFEAYFSVVEAGFRFSPDAGSAQSWLALRFPWPLTAAIIVHLVAAFRGPIYPRRRFVIIALYLIGVVGGILHLSTDLLLSEPVAERWGWSRVIPANPLSIALVLLTLGAILYSIAVFLILFVGEPRGHRRTEAALLTTSFAIPVLPIIADIIARGLGNPIPELASVGFLTQAILFGFVLTRSEAFRISPAAAADTILASLQDAVVLTDTTGMIVEANRSADQLFGHAQLVGNELTDMMIMDPETTLGMVDPDGEMIPVSWSRSEMSSGSVLVIRDERTNHEFEHRIREMEAQLGLKQRLESLGTLASGVAHELNNPLHAIINYAHLLQGDLTREQMTEFVAIIADQGERAAGIVADLRAFGRTDLDLELVAVKDVVNPVIRLLQTSLQDEGVRLDLDLNEDAMIFCRPRQMGQVLMNLITNARDAVRPEEPETRTIGLSVRESNNELRLQIWDQGQGISGEILPRLFDPFFTTKEGTGTGLGLWISHRIIDQHGGRIEVESDETGTRVTIVLLQAEPT